MEKNKRNKIIGLSIGILIVLIIVVSSTYAYWQITKTQKSPNDIVAACLSLDLKDASTENTGIDLDSAWPISDEEGKSLAGYTFTVTNNCAEEINYIVGLNRVEESTANYLLDSSIKLQLDDNSTFLYSDLSDVEYADAENTEYTARTSKQVSVETIGAKETNTHTIRVWVSEDAPVTEQSKNFLGQVFITGGQGIEVPECFTIANNGTILNYNYECGTEVKVPAEINGIQVKNIAYESFREGDIILYTGGYGELVTSSTWSNEEYIIYYKDTTNKVAIENYMKTAFCDDPENCNLADLGFYIYETVEEYNTHDWTKYEEISEAGSVMSYDKEYYEQNGDLMYSDAGLPMHWSYVTSLDLSEAVYLETIGVSAFKDYYGSDTQDYETCYEVPSNQNYSYKYRCRGLLEELILPQNGVLTTIGYSAFEENQLTELVIPASVETIDEEAFINNQIASLVFEDTSENPSQLITIVNNAFTSNQIAELIIPASVTKIGDEAFSANPLTDVIIKNTEGNVTIDFLAFPSTATITYNPDYTE